MHWMEWLGLALLLISLIIGFVIAAGVKTLQRVESYAKCEDGTQLVDRVIDVPPWNSTEGWVGFAGILSHQGKVGYEAYGVIIPNDDDPEPWMVMRAVNDTGLTDLLWDGFSESAWNITKIYAVAYLDKDQRYYAFRFRGLDESDKYVFLFRGLKEEAQSRPILISVKEAWYEGKTLLEPTMPNLFITVGIAAIGLYLVTKKPKFSHKKRLKKTK